MLFSRLRYQHIILLSDSIAVEAQRKAFAKMENIEWSMETRVEDFERKLRELTE
jgi:hypothetical protein